MTVFKNFFTKQFLNFFPILLFFLLVTIPMLLMKRDIWDGTSIQYASLVKDFSGLKMWFLDSGWILQYPFTVAIIKFSQFSHLSFKVTNAFIVFILMFFLLREVFFLCKKTFKLSKFSTYFSVVLVSTFPAWASLMSSVMTFHLSCIFAGLLSVRLIHGSGFKKVLGFFILIYSFGLNSNFTFLPVLSYCYDFFKKDETNSSYLIKPSLRTISIFILGLTVFLTHKNFFPPSHIYKGFNSLILFSVYGFSKTIFHMLKSSTYLSAIIFFSFLVFIFELVFFNKTHLSFDESDAFKHYKMVLIYLLVLFLSAIFPYAAVGKSNALWEIIDFYNHNAILFSVPVALFTACYLELLYVRYKSSLMKKIIQYSSLIFIFVNLGLLMPSIFFKLHQTIFVYQIEQLMKENKAKVPDSGLLQIIITEGIPRTMAPIRYYEANFMMYLATGNTDVFSTISKNKGFTQNDEYQSYKELRQKITSKQFNAFDACYIHRYDEHHINNAYLMEIQAEGFDGPSNIRPLRKLSFY